MSAAVSNCPESRWIPPEELDALYDQPGGRFTQNQFDATMHLYFSDMSGHQRKALFGHRNPVLDSRLDLMPDLYDPADPEAIAREKRVAAALRSYVLDTRARNLSIFYAEAGPCAPQIQEEVAPEAAKTLVIPSLMAASPTIEFEIAAKQAPDSAILPSPADLGFQGFRAHIKAERAALTARRDHLYAGSESALQATELPTGSFLGACGTRSIEIPVEVIDDALAKIFKEADSAVTEPIGQPIVLGETSLHGSGILGGNEDLAGLVQATIAAEHRV